MLLHSRLPKSSANQINPEQKELTKPALISDRYLADCAHRRPAIKVEGVAHVTREKLILAKICAIL